MYQSIPLQRDFLCKASPKANVKEMKLEQLYKVGSESEFKSRPDSLIV